MRVHEQLSLAGQRAVLTSLSGFRGVLSTAQQPSAFPVVLDIYPLPPHVRTLCRVSLGARILPAESVSPPPDPVQARPAEYSGQFSSFFLFSFSSLKPLVSTSSLRYSLYWISKIPYSGISPTFTGCFFSVFFISSLSSSQLLNVEMFQYPVLRPLLFSVSLGDFTSPVALNVFSKFMTPKATSLVSAFEV